MTGDIAPYGTSVRTLLDAVDEGLGRTLPGAAELVLDSVASGGLVYAAGAGHSLAMVCETFYRAGGLSCVRPLWHPDVFPLGNALGSTRAERTPGLGAGVLDDSGVKPNDVVVVFSTSGGNHYPVEIAKGCRDRGVDVIAVSSRAASHGAAARAGERLVDLATVVLDTCVPPGDVTFPAAEPRTSAVSTLLASYVWSALLAQLDLEAARRGLELPRWQSANVPGGDAANERHFERYGPVVPELGAQVGP